jgi:hypothetical protein
MVSQQGSISMVVKRMTPRVYGDVLRNKNNQKDGRSDKEQPSYIIKSID